MIVEAIGKVVEGGDLEMDEAASVMNEIMSGDATPAAAGSDAEEEDLVPARPSARRPPPLRAARRAPRGRLRDLSARIPLERGSDGCNSRIS